MNADELSLDVPSTPSATLLQRWARRQVWRLLERLEYGGLTLWEKGQRYTFGQPDAPLQAQLHVHDAALYPALLQQGGIGAAQAYMGGLWHSPDLTSLLQLFAEQLPLLERLGGRGRFWVRGLLRLWQTWRRNSERGARRNIAAHYDLGNDFFGLFLDETRMYSAAIFPTPDSTLEQASRHKLDHICQRLQLRADDHLLEIGSGWGGMALHAARHYGCRVTTTTISQEQYRAVCEAVAAAGLGDRITVLCEDYRKLRGQYDKLVSIEMIEAVGASYYPSYFAQCSALLKPEGLGLIQAITMPDQRYAKAQRSVDFIQRYIFPGGSLPSLGVIAHHLAQDTDCTLLGLEDITAHYARTLERWRERFEEQIGQVREQGFDERFIRMWRFYLCYCQAGFQARTIGTHQLLFAKPRYRQGRV